MRKTSKAKQPLQHRAIVTRRKIVNGAIQALASYGVANLTHRVVARAAGVSLAATTYHYATKQDILAETSRVLLDGYLEAFRRLELRLRTRQEDDVRTLEDLVVRVVDNSLGRDRERSLAWCELMLDGGRNAESRALAQIWYTELEEIWAGICDHLPSTIGLRANAAIDLAVGFIFLLHPLALDTTTVLDLLNGRIGLANLAPTYERPADEAALNICSDSGRGPRHATTRERLIEATIEILIQDGPGSVSHASVAARAGMLRSGPSYYFSTIDGLLRVAQMTLFARAKARYRSGISSISPDKIDETRLADLTTAIFFSELLKFPHESLGYYSAWMNSLQNTTLRPEVFGALYELNRAWSRRLSAVAGGDTRVAAPLWQQGLFAGKLIRGITAQPGTDDLARSREDFMVVIKSMPV